MNNLPVYKIILSEIFPKWHLHAGKSTLFKASLYNMLFGCSHLTYKIHAIRPNFNKWQRCFEKINASLAGIAIYHLRKDAKTNCSPLSKIVIFKKENRIGLQKLIVNSLIEPPVVISNNEARIVEWGDLARNSGLSIKDLQCYIEHYGLKKPLAIIHFTDFRY